MKRKDIIAAAARRRKRMEDLLAAGYSLAKIGRQFNCSRQRVWQILQSQKESA